MNIQNAVWRRPGGGGIAGGPLDVPACMENEIECELGREKTHSLSATLTANDAIHIRGHYGSIMGLRVGHF